MLLGLGLSIGVVLAVGALCFFQLGAAWRNQTGIEDWIMEKAAYRLRGQDREKQFVNPYRQDSRWRNLRQLHPRKRQQQLLQRRQLRQHQQRQQLHHHR